MSWGTGVRVAPEVSARAVYQATVLDAVVLDQGAVAGEVDVAAPVSEFQSIMVITPCAPAPMRFTTLRSRCPHRIGEAT